MSKAIYYITHLNKTKSLRLIGLLIAFWGGQQTFASAEGLQIELKVEKTAIGQEGEKVWVEAASALPGEVIRYTALYRNTTDSAMNNVKPVLPLPSGLECIEDSFQPIPAHVLLKEDLPLSYLQWANRKDSPDSLEPQAFEWTIPTLAPGETVAISMRAQVSSPSRL